MHSGSRFQSVSVVLAAGPSSCRPVRFRPVHSKPAPDRTQPPLRRLRLPSFPTLLRRILSAPGGTQVRASEELRSSPLRLVKI